MLLSRLRFGRFSFRGAEHLLFNALLCALVSPKEAGQQITAAYKCRACQAKQDKPAPAQRYAKADAPNEEPEREFEGLEFNHGAIHLCGGDA